MISHLAISLYFIYSSDCSFPLIFVDFCILGATTYNEFPTHFVLFCIRLPDAALRSSYGQLTEHLWASLGETDETSQETGISAFYFPQREPFTTQPHC